MLSYILALALGALLLCGDIITKQYIVANFTLNEERDFLGKFLNLHYIHNKGGAWGFLDGNTWILVAVSIVLMLVCVAMLLKKGFNNKILFWSVSFILFGGLGNMIDRIFRGGNVVDFLQFGFIDFPIFNVADCGVVIGATLLLVYFAVETVKDVKAQKEH